MISPTSSYHPTRTSSNIFVPDMLHAITTADTSTHMPTYIYHPGVRECVCFHLCVSQICVCFHLYVLVSTYVVRRLGPRCHNLTLCQLPRPPSLLTCSGRSTQIDISIHAHSYSTRPYTSMHTTALHIHTRLHTHTLHSTSHTPFLCISIRRIYWFSCG